MTIAIALRARVSAPGPHLVAPRSAALGQTNPRSPLAAEGQGGGCRRKSAPSRSSPASRGGSYNIERRAFAAPGDLFPCSGEKIPCYPPEQGIPRSYILDESYSFGRITFLDWD
jgi:hypothetical protein